MIFNQFHKKIITIGIINIVLSGFLYAKIIEHKHKIVNPQPEPPGKIKHRFKKF